MTNFKSLKTAALVLVLGLGIIGSAQAGHRGDRVAAAIVVSSLIGAAVAANQPVYAAPPAYGYYEPAPVYYAPTPVYYAPAPVYVGPRYGHGYRSYGGYRGHGGQRSHGGYRQHR